MNDTGAHPSFSLSKQTSQHFFLEFHFKIPTGDFTVHHLGFYHFNRTSAHYQFHRFFVKTWSSAPLVLYGKWSYKRRNICRICSYIKCFPFSDFQIPQCPSRKKQEGQPLMTVLTSHLEGSTLCKATSSSAGVTGLVKLAVDSTGNKAVPRSLTSARKNVVSFMQDLKTTCMCFLSSFTGAPGDLTYSWNGYLSGWFEGCPALLRVFLVMTRLLCPVNLNVTHFSFCLWPNPAVVT